MHSTTKYPHQCGSSQFSDDEVFPQRWTQIWPVEGADDLVEYLHEVDVCAEEEFWWDEEDRHEL